MFYIFLIYICLIKLKQNTKKMRKFKLSIYKGHELGQEKEVIVNSREELKEEKAGFWSESPFKKGVNRNWMGVKRIR